MLHTSCSTARSDPRFLIESWEPTYLKLAQNGVLASRVAAALQELEHCGVCPRGCHGNRQVDESPVCRTGRYARVTGAFPHHGEERCLRGQGGSGTIFFNLCNLRCVFCQNWDVSQQVAGEECTARQLADLMLSLQEQGCPNINFVTPEHVVPQVVEALGDAIPRGFRLPIVYNTSGYDSLESLKLLDGLVDIYLPDFKFWRRDTSARLVKAEDYPDRARDAIREMHRQVGPLRFGRDGVARRGVLVRHLVMPNHLTETEAIMDWLGREISPDTYVNIMAHYRPAFKVGQFASDASVRYADLNRPLLLDELQRAYQAARQAGLWRFDDAAA